MAPQIVHEIKPRRLTVAGAAAIASLALVMWAFVREAYSTSDVENCDSTLGPAARGFDFSGVFDGRIFDGGQNSAAALVKFVRNRNAVKGSCLRDEICGVVSGKITLDRLEFNWKWSGNSGHGIASHTANRVSGTFGFGEDAKGGGTFVLIQRQAGRPPAARPEQRLFEASDLNKRAIELDNAGRYSDAEPLYKRALAIREKALGPDHSEVSVSLLLTRRQVNAVRAAFKAGVTPSRIARQFGPTFTKRRRRNDVSCVAKHPPLFTCSNLNIIPRHALLYKVARYT